MSLRTVVKTCGLSMAASGAIIAFGWLSFILVSGHEGFDSRFLLPLAAGSLVSPFFLFPWIRATRRLQDAQHNLRHMARTDMLTGLANRWAFFDETACATADKDAIRAILMIDIDYFKKVNDTYGHVAGDDVLRQVAAAIASTVTGSCATRPVIARMGGEEFCVACEIPSRNAACDLAASICNAVRISPVMPDRETCVTVSVGIALYSDSADLDSALSAADDAAYQAKNAGRDRWCIASDSGTLALQRLPMRGGRQTGEAA
ncbi:MULTISPECIES: GGDEF domain-containing protein [unclassified Aurantimonas]|uniref:GGDEF domain-containing protein n=2 Tax=Aurantimonas TaxID=182269 RepID=UPI002E17E76D|nr:MULTISPECIES: GGDEF domain-containing protein [unclassified Aurantimonas]MEC5293353.1 GGDEF domain-containing protein [Aurantimonas sp. C2-3-R2]MEC5414435.1 GGDEF domain-containing protein [Aurantimonas sp. C2-4-R8]